MAEPRATRDDPRVRRLLSSLTSVALHLVVLVGVAPCVGRPERLVRVAWFPDAAVEAQREAARLRLEAGEIERELEARQLEARQLEARQLEARQLEARRIEARDREPTPEVQQRIAELEARRAAIEARLVELEERQSEREERRPEGTPERKPEVVRVVFTERPGERPDDPLAESRYDQAADELRRSPVVSERPGPTSPSSPESVAVRATDLAAGEPTDGRAAPDVAASAPPAPAPAPPPAPAAEAEAADTVAAAATPATWWEAFQRYVPSLPGLPWRQAPEGEVAAPTEVAAQTTPPEEAAPPIEARPDEDPVEGTTVEPPEHGVDVAEEQDPPRVAAAEPPPSPTTDPVVGRTPVEANPGREATTAQTEADPRTAAAPRADDPADTLAEAAQSAASDDAVAEAGGEPGATSRVPTLDTTRAPASSHQTVIDAAEAASPQVAARATVRGAWIQAIDEVIRARWNAQEFPAHLAAMGVRGDTTVRFTVQPNGRTGAIAVVRRSGNETLDAIALAAIPERVPRMPPEVDPVAVEHEITFRYR